MAKKDHGNRTVKIFDRQYYPAGRVLIHEGDFNSKAYYIESGKVEVFTTDKKGREIILAHIGPSQLVGEMAIISKKTPRTASVRVIEDSILISVSQEIEKAFEDMDAVMKVVLETLVDRIRKTNKNLVHQRGELADFEETTQMTVKNISATLSPRKQEQFKKEITPVLDELRNVLAKYQKPGEKRLETLSPDEENN